MQPKEDLAAQLYPEGLSSLYTQKGLENRFEFNDRMLYFAGRHLERTDLPDSERAFIVSLNTADQTNILLPNETFLNEAESPFDLIVVSFRYAFDDGDSKVVALMEDYSNPSPLQRGFGKTGASLILLGVTIPYERGVYPQSRDNEEDAVHAMRELEKSSISSFPFEDTGTRLISADFAYLGGVDGKLDIASIVGEPFMTQWDVARHMARQFDSYYYGNDGRPVPWLKEYLAKLAEKNYLAFGEGGVFDDLFSSKHLDELYVVQYGERLEIRRVDDARGELLYNLLLGNPIKHPTFPVSGFWSEDSEEHNTRVANVCRTIKEAPNIWLLNLPFEEDVGIEVIAEFLGEHLENNK